jgi:transcriptional activator for dhaKLM operon
MEFISDHTVINSTSFSMDQLLENWQAFVTQRMLSPRVSPYIAASWQRCLPFINPTDRIIPNRLSEEHLHAARVANPELVSLALPVMEDIYQYIENAHSLLLLTNSACCVLEIVGDPAMIALAEQAGIVPGAMISEQQFGTNSIALSVSERTPVQVRGAEHFLRQMHSFADVAAPIFFYTGRLLGSIALVTTCEYFTEHALGLVTSAASAIAVQRQSDMLLADYNNQLAKLNAVLGSVTEGVLVWDEEETLLHVNVAAEKMMNLPAQALLGRSFRRFISLPPFIDDAIKRHQTLENISGRIHLGERQLHFIVNLKFVETGHGIFGAVFTFRSESEDLHLLEQNQLNMVSQTLDSLVGESAGTRRVRQLARMAASARASVLIRGEHGTGKTLLASAIHNTSPRREEPFVICASASIPKDLMMVELVGLEKGVSSKEPWGQAGKFELAHNGTLYIQDIEALTLEAQTALLNLLELGIVQRLGKSRPAPVDVRIIASTSVDLEKLIEAGSFRGDLYYRLSPFEIRIPPLRERPADIPMLVDNVLDRLAIQFNRPIKVKDDAMYLLRRYQWPGNISELETLLARTASQMQGKDEIDAEDLPVFVRQPNPLSFEIAPNVLVNSLDEMEREALLQAARSCRGHLGKMSKMLGVSRTTLWRKLKAYDISAQEFRSK